MIARVLRLLKRIERRLYLEIKRSKLKNKTVTIISSNCNGGFILHDMKCRFNTPTINLFFMPDDFLKLLQNPRHYFSAEPVELIDSGYPYPIGRIDDIYVHYMHYKTFDDAKNKWIERSKRIDYENIVVMMTEQNGCTYEQLQKFDDMPYKNKVVFTVNDYSELYSSYCIHGCVMNQEVGVLSDLKPGVLYRRWIDSFDYVSLMNHAGEKLNFEKRG